MCKIAEWFDCIIAPERSDSACYKLSKTQDKTVINFYLVGL